MADIFSVFHEVQYFLSEKPQSICKNN